MCKVGRVKQAGWPPRRSTCSPVNRLANRSDARPAGPPARQPPGRPAGQPVGRAGRGHQLAAQSNDQLAGRLANLQARDSCATATRPGTTETRLQASRRGTPPLC